MINENSTVEIHYTGKKVSTNEEFDSSVKRNESFSFQLGQGQVIKGLEEVLIGKEEGDKFTAKINKENAYGEYNETAVENVPIDKMPTGSETGKVVVANAPDGSQQYLLIKSINEKFAVLDLNHPLAGEDLEFEIEVLSVK